MEHLDRLIPLAVLFVVAAILIALLRRATRETTEGTEPRREVALRPTPAVVVAPKIEPAPAPAPSQTAAPPLKPPKQARPTPTGVPAAPPKTPIHRVLDLVQEKDALVTAFLLGEILGAPVSKRSTKSEPPV
jgi:hypothetical protein